MVLEQMPDFENFSFQTPPPDTESNFQNPDSSAPQLYIGAGACFILLAMFASLRFYARLSIIQKTSICDCKCYLNSVSAALIFIYSHILS